eukprot:500810_1
MSASRLLRSNTLLSRYKPCVYHRKSSQSLIYQSHHFLSTHSQSILHTKHKTCSSLNNSITHTKPSHQSFSTKPESKADEEEEDEDENQSEDWEYREIDDEAVKTRNYQILSWRTVIGTIIVFGIGTIIFQQQLHKHRQKQRAPEYESYGEAQIGGGEWKMTDHNNKQIDQTSLIGKYQVVYFGFTFCPDVCPRELTKMANAMHLLKERGYKIGEDILPVFVSVDPKRDTPQLIKKYIRQFHPQIYGLTGSPTQVAKFAKAYKAYFSTPGPGENTEDYIIDHVTMMYVMGRQGEYIGHISTLENADEMADKIANMIKDVGHSGGFLGTW